MSGVDWRNPYGDGAGAWLRGNLHTHTSPASACGQVPVDRVLDHYARLGYDFVAVSDHMHVTSARHPRLTLLPGIEWNSGAGEHTGVYTKDASVLERAIGIGDHGKLLSYLARTDALVVLNHPNWMPTPHYRREQLVQASHFHGVEVYNHVIERLSGVAIAADKWDHLLAKGRRVLGFASDDSHIPEDVGGGWIMVRSKARTAGAILAAIKKGRFYCSSGVVVDEVRRKGSVVTLETHNAQEIRVVTDDGAVVKRVKRKAALFDMADLHESRTYVRFEAYGRGSTMAWTQPFFVE